MKNKTYYLHPMILSGVVFIPSIYYFGFFNPTFRSTLFIAISIGLAFLLELYVSKVKFWDYSPTYKLRIWNIPLTAVFMYAPILVAIYLSWLNFISYFPFLGGLPTFYKTFIELVFLYVYTTILMIPIDILGHGLFGIYRMRKEYLPSFFSLSGLCWWYGRKHFYYQLSKEEGEGFVYTYDSEKTPMAIEAQGSSMGMCFGYGIAFSFPLFVVDKILQHF